VGESGHAVWRREGAAEDPRCRSFGCEMRLWLVLVVRLTCLDAQTTRVGRDVEVVFSPLQISQSNIRNPRISIARGNEAP
jgi:hypothetical protein